MVVRVYVERQGVREQGMNIYSIHPSIHTSHHFSLPRYIQADLTVDVVVCLVAKGR